MPLLLVVVAEVLLSLCFFLYIVESGRGGMRKCDDKVIKMGISLGSSLGLSLGSKYMLKRPRVHGDWCVSG